MNEHVHMYAFAVALPSFGVRGLETKDAIQNHN